MAHDEYKVIEVMEGGCGMLLWGPRRFLFRSWKSSSMNTPEMAGKSYSRSSKPADSYSSGLVNR